MIPDFSAQFRPRYVWNNDTMLRAWWWAMYWPWTVTSFSLTGERAHELTRLRTD